MSNASQVDEFNQALKQLQLDFLSNLTTEFAKIKDLKNQLKIDDNGEYELKELKEIFHRLAGSSGSFGLTELGVEAKKVETWLKEKLENKNIIISENDITVIKNSLTTLNAARSQEDSDPTFQIKQLESIPSQKDQLLFWLVEDDELLAKELKRQFETFGYKTVIFSDLESAEKAAEDSCPDAILLDVMFKDNNINATAQFAQCENLKRLDSIIIFMSAYDDFESRVGAVKLNARGYFLKPVSVPAIVNHLRRIFEISDIPSAHILIIEDDEALANHYKLVLQAAGYEAECLFEPEKIIQTLATFNPEIVLLDLHMPKYSGMEIAGVIRQHEKWTGLPILYLSAETDIELQAKALEKGAEDFLPKPINDHQLLATVKARIIRTRQLDEKISRDSLTGLLKHGVIKDSVNHEVKRAIRKNSNCSIAMIDIDNFKSVNDSYGHAVGDVVITAIATVLQQRLRKSDIIGRYGGEEFVVILPDCSFSAGLVSTESYPKLDGNDLLNTADASLYHSKTNGRNQITISSPENN